MIVKVAGFFKMTKTTPIFNQFTVITLVHLKRYKTNSMMIFKKVINLKKSPLVKPNQWIKELLIMVSYSKKDFGLVKIYFVKINISLMKVEVFSCMTDEYYVYGLIDPRDNSIFYIGKGKGNRVEQHFTEKTDYHSNTGKLGVIEEIKKTGQQVPIIMIGENLSEESSFLLERILIYRLGRRIFDEGVLTNIVPGGKWTKESPMFIKEDKLPSFETIREKFPELVEILDKYPKVSKEFKGLGYSENPDNELLYVYEGNKIREFTIEQLISIFSLGSSLDIINSIKGTDKPIYFSGRVWTKRVIPIPDVSFVPYQDGDIIDFSFVEKVNEVKEIDGNNHTIQTFYPNGILHCELNILRDETTFKYYYSNGNLKHLSTTKNGILHGECQKYYETGILKESIEYIDGKEMLTLRFYSSGVIDMEGIYNEKSGFQTTKVYYENGKLSYEMKEDGSSETFDEKGNRIGYSERYGDPNNGGYVMIFQLFEDGKVKKETKMYYFNGLLHGYEKSFFDTGGLRKFKDYTEGFKNTIITTYKKNGEIQGVKKTDTFTWEI